MNNSNIDYTNLSSAELISLAKKLELMALENTDPELHKSILSELKDQRTYLKLIASENFSSLAVQGVMGNWLTDKYAEGYPNHRFYAGCENVDEIENIAIERAKKLFQAEHAYVQPHSGADANLIAYVAILKAKVEHEFLHEIGEKNLQNLNQDDWEKLREIMLSQTMLAMDYKTGGHISHGYRMNVSANLFRTVYYGVDEHTNLINYDEIRSLALKHKPLFIIAGYSSYPRKINFQKFREIANEIGAVLMVDMAHFAGLVAGKVYINEYNPVPYADIITTTTHKTMRGPRGGLILCKQWLADFVDKGCPYVIGGPLENMIAAKAVCFKEALEEDFSRYAQKILENSNLLAKELINLGLEVVTKGTENHMVLVDVNKTFNINGRVAEKALRECGLTVNRNILPFDRQGPWYTSGIRIGTPAITTLGMGENEVKIIARLIFKVLSAVKTIPESKTKYELNEGVASEVKHEVENLLNKFPLYPKIEF